jgi:hypothetical protein
LKHLAALVADGMAVYFAALRFRPRDFSKRAVS